MTAATAEADLERAMPAIGAVARPARFVLGCAALCVIVQLLSGCARDTTELYHPTTGAKVVCDSGRYFLEGAGGHWQEYWACIDNYEKQGYVRDPQGR